MNKKHIALTAAAMACLLALWGCAKDIDDIVDHEPCVKGVVTETADGYVVIDVKEENGSYKSYPSIQVSLDVERKDSQTDLEVGDEIAVYYDGTVLETDPAKIKTVYAILEIGGGEEGEERSSVAKEAPGEAVVFSMSPTKDRVAEFLERLEDLEELPEGGTDDECWNITPQEITDRYGFEIFKFEKSFASYLLYQDQIYPLGVWMGGSGAAAFAVADVDQDQGEELYFTYSWGFGADHSTAGYFDPASGGIVMFAYTDDQHDLMFAADGDGLKLYRAKADVTSSAEIHLEALEQVGEIVLESGSIVLKETDGNSL